MAVDSNKKVVLAIDDDPQQLENYKLQLGQKYDLRVAGSVELAIGFLVKNKADIILLDIEMPEINGFEFLANIKSILKGVQAPVIIVSSNNDEDFFKQVQYSDAFTVLTKPVKQDALIRVIERALSAKPWMPDNGNRYLFESANIS